MPVIYNVDIYFIADHEQIIFLCQLYHSLDYFNRIYSPSGIIWVDYQNTCNRRIIFYAFLKILKVRIPVIMRIKFIGDRPVPCMGRLC